MLVSFLHVLYSLSEIAPVSILASGLAFLMDTVSHQGTSSRLILIWLVEHMAALKC